MNQRPCDRDNIVHALSAVPPSQHHYSSSNDTLYEVVPQLGDISSVVQCAGSAVARYRNAMVKRLNAYAISLVESSDTLGGSGGRDAALQEAASCLHEALLKDDILAAVLHLPTDWTFSNSDANVFRSTNSVASTSLPISMNIEVSRRVGQLQVEMMKGPEYDEGMHVFPDLLCIADDYDQSQGLCDVKENAKCQAYQLLPATVMHNLGQIRMKQQRWEDGYNCFVDAFILTELASAASGTEIAVSALHNIGYIQYRCGEINRSLQTFTKALSICELDASINNAHVAATLNCIGVLLFYQSAECNGCGISTNSVRTTDSPFTRTADKALECLLRALALQRLHSSDRTLATTLNNLGRVFYVREGTEASLEAYHEALRLRRKVLGDDHLDVAATIFNIAQTLHYLGSLDSAMHQYDAFLRICVPILGDAQRDVAYALKCKAQIYQERGDINKAVSFYRQALQSTEAALGLHAEVAFILNKLGNLYYDKGDYATSLAIYTRGLAVERAIFDQFHPNITVTLSNMAQIHRQRGDIVKAFQVYEEVVRLQKASLGGQHPDVAHSLSNLALLHYQRHNYATALDLYQEALTIRREYYGEMHLDVAGTLNSLGLVLFKLGIPNVALDCFLRSLSIRQALLGPSHREVAFNLYNVATIHIELGNLEEALRCYKETLRIETMGNCDGHNIDLSKTLLNIAHVHEQNGEDELALEHYKKALHLQLQTLPDNDPATGRTLILIGNFHLQRACGGQHLGDGMNTLANALRIHEANGGSVGDFNELKLHLYELAKLHSAAAAAA